MSANISELIEQIRTDLAFSDGRYLGRCSYDNIRRLLDHIAELEEGQYAERNLLTLFLCIDFDRFTEHDEALLDSVTEDSRRLLASPLPSAKGGLTMGEREDWLDDLRQRTERAQDLGFDGYCTDCENAARLTNGRCGCGSGRVATLASLARPTEEPQR